MSELPYLAPALCQSQHSRSYVRKTALCFLLTLFVLAPGLVFLLRPVFDPQYQQQESDLAIGGAFCAFSFLFFLLFLFFLSRWLLPQKGRLARSIFIQLGGGARGDIRQLFREIDEDVASGRSFGSIHVGEEWILGEEAMLLSQLRGVFGFESRRHKGRREYTLCLVDREDRVQTSAVALSEDLRAVMDYLVSLVPAVATGGMDAYTRYLAMEKGEKQALLKRFDQCGSHPAPEEEPQPPKARFLYTGREGEELPDAGWEDILSDMRQLEEGQNLRLLAEPPIPSAPGESLGLLCQRSGEEYYIAAVFRQGRRPLRFSRTMPFDEAVALFERYYRQQLLPDLEGWEDESAQYAHPAPRPEGCTLRVDGNRVGHVTFAEVTAALDGLDAGAHHFFLLARSGSGCMAVAHEQEKVGYTVGVVQRVEGEDRTLETEMENRIELQQWLSNYYHHGALPDTIGWQDKTEEAQLARQQG